MSLRMKMIFMQSTSNKFKQRRLKRFLRHKRKHCNFLFNFSQKTLTKQVQVVQKPKIPQTIQPKTSWKLINEFTKQSLDKLRIEGDTDVDTM